jgi:hypothetical protein
LRSNDPVHLQPIDKAALAGVGQFLHENLNRRITPARWASSIDPPWSTQAPNFGFMLLAGEEIVGVHLAFYSHRILDGEIVRFCNLAAFCVLEDYRWHSLRLLKALLAQDGYHFTDLSPSGNVVPLNTRLKFHALETATALVPNLPWPLWSSRTRVISDPALIQSKLRGDDLRIYNDHAHAAAAQHALILRDGESCYVVFRRDHRKNLRLFASILHVGNPKLFKRTASHFFRHLLIHHGIPVTFAELRVVRDRPAISIMLPSPRPKMYRSGRLRPEQIDYLYSELTCVAW